MNGWRPVIIAIAGLLGVFVGFLLVPWIITGLNEYSDWVWCLTNDPEDWPYTYYDPIWHGCERP